MNRIINILTISFLILLSYNCSDDFLDRNHPGSMSFDKIYKTKKDFDAALAGCYSSFQSQASVMIFFGDFPSDNVYASRYNPADSWTDIKRHTYTAMNDQFKSFWFNSYRTIQRVNLLLEMISGASIEDKDKAVISAEAKFLRAHSYFYLLRIFGGVPLYDRYTDVQDMYDAPRASVEDVKTLIINDLNEVKNIDSYRSSGDNAVGRATSIAAKTLMAKTYMWVKDFANAETVLADIVNTGGLDLVDFSKLYQPDQPVNKEIIFSINYERTATFSFPYMDMVIPYQSPAKTVYPNYDMSAGYGYGMIEPYIVNKFSTKDKRLALIDTLTFEFLGTTDENIFSLKYVDRETSVTGLSGANVIVLRYADVLLMYAEALNENGKTTQAYSPLNRVRNRAGIGDLPAGYTKEQMFQALADERQKEFIMEGDRWFDLVFRGLTFLKKEMNSCIPNSYLEINKSIKLTDNCLLFPIPESELQIKPVLTQNPGY